MSLRGRALPPRAAAVLLLLAACGGGDVASTAPPPPRAGVPLAACPAAGPDSDGDGLTDACETGLASAFAPVLVAAPDACAGDAGPPGGGYLHGVLAAGDGVRLVYLPAYFLDCGWSGPKCLLPGVDCAPHAGDSEFLAVDVSRVGGAWRVDGVFLSAHCFDGSDGGCRWYRGRALDRFAWAGAAPVVWVAEGRHANYPSRKACDRGHHGIDTCDRNALRRPFPVEEGRNVGSEAAPGPAGADEEGCVPGAAVAPRGAVAADAIECFWSERPFRGWQGRGEGVTPYLRYLRHVAAVASTPPPPSPVEAP